MSSLIQLSCVCSTACPSCGCTTVVREEIEVGHDGKIHQHCNGQRWEARTFACGVRFRWVPNFGVEEISQECRRTDAYVRWEAERVRLRAEIDQLHGRINSP